MTIDNQVLNPPVRRHESSTLMSIPTHKTTDFPPQHVIQSPSDYLQVEDKADIK